MLKLYELRREPRLRQARSWFEEHFAANSLEELREKCPPGSEENLNVRMTISYWDMVANIVARGLINEEFFFENTGEIFAVWEKIRAVTVAWRELVKDPSLFANLEELCQRMEAWKEKRAPGSVAAMRQLMEQMRQARAKAAGQ